MFSPADGVERRDGVNVVRSRNDHSVDLLFVLVEQFPEVLVLRKLGMLGEDLLRIILVDVAERDELRSRVEHGVAVALALAAAADLGKAEGFLPGCEGERRGDGRRSAGGRGLQEAAAGEWGRRSHGKSSKFEINYITGDARIDVRNSGFPEESGAGLSGGPCAQSNILPSRSAKFSHWRDRLPPGSPGEGIWPRKPVWASPGPSSTPDARKFPHP